MILVESRLPDNKLYIIYNINHFELKFEIDIIHIIQ